MAYKRPTNGENSPTVSLEDVFGGADSALRALARAAVGLEKARAGARAREAARVAAKYGAAHPRAKAAAAAAKVHADHLAEARRMAGRADLAPVDVPAQGAAIAGRVIDRAGSGVLGLTVQVIDARDHAIAHARTDATGVFRIILEHAAPAKAEREPLVMVEHKAPSPSDERSASVGDAGTMRVVVLDSKTELHRDAQPFSVQTGRVLYREITIAR
ncbi:MAG TPA: carboxypeptidase-like regulatory domain-containing protein [Kofleriaceae bacterium]|jgi:hypothetical protein|nr:carboxypeptidase-like regulatory domain-containing protein [Kofleriaceae bacterium]